jgi:hypothetical protein
LGLKKHFKEPGYNQLQMTSQERSNNFQFSKPAIYKIRVQGELNDHFSRRLGGMQITIERKNGRYPVSVLIGKLSDQAALSGILNTLYEMHLTVLSVQALEEMDKE